MSDDATDHHASDHYAADHHASSAAHPDNVAPAASVEAVREALRHGPRGALAIASTTTAMLIIAWLAFYFLLFLPRGGIA